MKVQSKVLAVLQQEQEVEAVDPGEDLQGGEAADPGEHLQESSENLRQ